VEYMLQCAATPCRTMVWWPSLWQQYTTSAFSKWIQGTNTNGKTI